MIANMNLSPIDLIICGVYLVSVLGVGIYFTVHRKKVAQASQISKPQDDTILNDYYLGGRRIPWWALAVADVSSYIDISGTMINTALIYALGVKGMYIEIRGGLCLFFAFQLAYTGKLSRRCPVKTRGEWIKFRFGDRRNGVMLRTTIACTSLISGILAVTYFAVGAGKFFTEFFTFSAYWGLPSEFWGAAMLMMIAIFYTIAAGFTTVVYTDVYQSLFIFSTFVIVSIMGMGVSLPDTFSVFLPRQDFPYHEPKLIRINVTQVDWLSALPPRMLHLPPISSYSMYESFDTIILTYLAVQFMRSASGPGGSGLQTVLATKSEKEVRLQTFLAMLLMAFRWGFSGGIAVLGIRYTTVIDPEFSIDPERVVPIVINNMLPEGIKGFVLASLFAAALTTFDTTINSASSYWTVDVYHALINVNASEKELLWHARISTLIVMLCGLFLSLHIESINRIWGFMTIALAGAFVWPFFFAWYWSRFNATGCLAGIITGFGAAIALFVWAPHFPELTSFWITSSLSGCTAVLVCLSTKPVSSHVACRFYRFARPPGIWNDLKQSCFSKTEIIEINQENRSDLLCTGLIAIVQLSLYVLSVSIVTKAWMQSFILMCVICVISPLIYFNWYLQLKDHPVGLPNELHEDLLPNNE